MSALTTEHHMLQGSSGSATGEGFSRASIYLSALSSGLVAIGFASISNKVLPGALDTSLDRRGQDHFDYTGWLSGPVV